MAAQAVYLQNVLVPQARRIENVEPKRISELAPVEWKTPYVAFLDGEPILRANWELVVEDGHSIAFIDVNAIPQGGGGGGSDPVRLVLTLAVMVYAPQLAGYLEFAAMGSAAMSGTVLATGAMWGAAATMVGLALVNAILPPPKPPSSQMAAAMAAPSPTYSLGAQGNSGRLESAIPEHFGSHIVFPDFAAQPYAEFSGNEQYLYQLLCVGRGEYDISDLRVEDTAISSFNEITYEIVPPGGNITLFPANVVNSIEVSGQKLNTGVYLGPFTANAAGTEANFLGLDIVAPRGLYYANDSGTFNTVSANIRVEARLIDAAGAPIGGWVTLTSGVVYGPWSDWAQVSAVGTNTDTVEYATAVNFVWNDGSQSGENAYTYTRRTRGKFYNSQDFSGATNTPQRYSLRYPVAAGRYEVRVIRTDAEQTSARYGHELVWAGLRAYLPEVRDFGDVTLLAVRMRASNNLSSQASRKINLIATRRLPTWNGVSWSAPVATRSIAWPIAYACKQIGMTDQQIDLPTLRSLDTLWAARGDYFDARFDNFLSFWEALTKIAAAGRAKPYMQGGVLRIMRDQHADVPVAMFSMRNIVKGSFSVDYLMPTEDTADAVTVGYFDRVNWKPSQVVAKLPGSVASKPARIDLFGVTGRDHAFREGMYHAGSNRYRRKLIKFATEMEGFIPSFGDLIHIQHDMPGWGQGGEVVGWDAATLKLTLSEVPTWASGNHYIALRKRDGSVDGPHRVSAGTAPNEVYLLTAPANAPYLGQDGERTHYAFGWADTFTQPARVLAIRPKGLRQVEIEAVNEDENVHTVELGATTPVKVTSQLAMYTSKPVVTGLVANRVLGKSSSYALSWAPSAWATSYVVEQGSDTDGWTRVADVTGTSYTIVLKSRDISVRVAAIGLSIGPWSVLPITIPPPENVQQFTVDKDVLSWTSVTDYGLAGYIIKFNYGNNTWWDTAGQIHVGVVSSSPYQLVTHPAGVVTMLVKAIDIDGYESAEPASIVLNLGDPLVDNLLVDYPQAPTFAGVISGASVVGGQLAANTTDLFYGPDTEVFYGADTLPFYAGTTYAELVYTVAIPITETGNLQVQHSLVASQYSIKYLRHNQSSFYGPDSDLFYGPNSEAFYGDPGSWTTWPGSADAVAGEVISFEVRTSAGDTQGVVSVFTPFIDVPDIIEYFDDVVIAPTGTRLPVTSPFRFIKNVQLTVQADGNGATNATVLDKDPTLGPLVQTKNISDTPVTGLLDAVVQGY